MSERSKEQMKQLIADKHKHHSVNNKYKPNRKMGSTHKAYESTKTGGSNNKV